MDESEVQFVMDTYAGETEVPGLPDGHRRSRRTWRHALQSFASKFQSDKVKHEGCSLMLPVLFPRLYAVFFFNITHFFNYWQKKLSQDIHVNVCYYADHVYIYARGD
jgi:hypothetical protein